MRVATSSSQVCPARLRASSVSSRLRRNHGRAGLVSPPCRPAARVRMARIPVASTSPLLSMGPSSAASACGLRRQRVGKKWSARLCHALSRGLAAQQGIVAARERQHVLLPSAWVSSLLRAAWAGDAAILLPQQGFAGGITAAERACEHRTAPMPAALAALSLALPRGGGGFGYGFFHFLAWVRAQPQAHRACHLLLQIP